MTSFFFNDTATTEIYTLSLHDALPILLGVLAGVLAKATGGRMPADQETIRYTGVHGFDEAGEPYLMREVLGGGSGGRYYADGEDTIHVVPDSRNQIGRAHV